MKEMSILERRDERLAEIREFILRTGRFHLVEPEEQDRMDMMMDMMEEPVQDFEAFLIVMGISQEESEDLGWVSLCTELYRSYRFPNGLEVLIDLPVALLSDQDSGGNCIYDAEGGSHYIPEGWCHLSWKVHEGCPPFD